MGKKPGVTPQQGFDVAIHLRGAVETTLQTDAHHRRRARDHYELYTCQRGTISISIAGSICDMQAGTATIIPPGLSYSDHNPSSSGQASAIIVGFDVLQSQGPDPLALLGLPVVVAWQRPNLRRQLLLRCIRLAPYRGGHPSDRIEASGLAQSLIGAYITSGLQAQVFTEQQERELPDWLWALINELDEGFEHRKWSVADMAAAAGLSSSRFAHVFKDYMGTPPKTWLRHRALNRGLQLLQQHPDWSIADIARQCGWSDRDEFSRRFRSHFGYTPSQAQQDQHRA